MASAPGLRAELGRRKSNADAVLALFKSRPNEWIDWPELAIAGGACAWRTRVADARKIVQQDGGEIEWNRKRRSAYRYLVQVPLGRDPQVPAPDRWPVFGAPAYEEPFELKAENR